MAFETAAEAIEHITTNEPMFALGEAEIRGIRLPVFQNAPPHLRAVLQLAVAEHGDATFLVFEEERSSFSDFNTQVNRLAQALVDEYGIKAGDRVAICMRNYPEYMVAMMAIVSIGAVIVFLNSWWTGEELIYGFEDSGAKLVFTDGPRGGAIAPFAQKLGISMVMVRSELQNSAARGYQDVLASVPSADVSDVEIAPDADFAVMYTSGSTGHPKGVVSSIADWSSSPFSSFGSSTPLPIASRTSATISQLMIAEIAPRWVWTCLLYTSPSPRDRG